MRVSNLKVLVLSALLLVASTVSGQTLLVDQTRSMANQAQIQVQLALVLAEEVGDLTSLDVVLINEGALSARSETVVLKHGKRSVFESIASVQEKRDVEARRASLMEILGRSLPQPARTSDIRAQLLRAGQSGAGLLVTDGRQEPRIALGKVTDQPVIVILCMANGDTDEYETFQRRRRELQAAAPNARIFGQSELREAVRAFVSAAAQAQRSSNEYRPEITLPVELVPESLPLPRVQAEALLEADALDGAVGFSERWGSGWIDLRVVRDFDRGERLRLHVGGTASQVVVRLLSLFDDANEPVGIEGGVTVIPEARRIDLVLQSGHRSVRQISVHGGPSAFGAFRFDPQNGAATLTRVERLRKPAIGPALRAISR